MAFLGCSNTEVTNAVLDGLKGLVMAMVDAFFLAITPPPDTTNPVTTWIIDAATSLFC